MLRSTFITILGLFLNVINLYAQEINCRVSVFSQQLSQSNSTIDHSIFRELEKQILDFMNNRKWTSDQFEVFERIEMNIMINVTESPSTDNYRGNLQIQSRRPVYNSTYSTTIFNFRDEDFSFTYVPFQPFEFSESANLSNLTSVLAFYAYYIIGLDYDTYSLEGGSPHFSRAQNIVANCQGAPERGWKAFENNRNRYWLLEDYLNPAFKNIRKVMYEYHRLGFDKFSTEFETERKNVLESLRQLDEIYRQRPNAFILQIFFASKREEILSLMKDAPKQEIQTLVPILAKLDGANAGRYTSLLK